MAHAFYGTAALGLLLGGSLPGGVVARARAAETGLVRMFADAAVGARLVAASAPFTGTAHVEMASPAVGAACATAPGAAPRLAWVTGAPEGLQSGRCVDDPNADFVYVPVGYRAVALVVPARAQVWSVAAHDIYRVLENAAQHTGTSLAWSDLSAEAPRLPASVLGPAQGSDTERLFLSRVVMPGCAAACGALPANPTRTPVQDATPPKTPDLKTWALMAPDGQIGVVDAAELPGLDPQMLPLPLDGVLPTAANITNGRYAAAEPVGLMAVLPHAATRRAREAARRLSFELLSEAAVGAGGAWANAGLVVMPAAARVAARDRVATFFAP